MILNLGLDSKITFSVMNNHATQAITKATVPKKT